MPGIRSSARTTESFGSLDAEPTLKIDAETTLEPDDSIVVDNNQEKNIALKENIQEESIQDVELVKENDEFWDSTKAMEEETLEFLQRQEIKVEIKKDVIQEENTEIIPQSLGLLDGVPDMEMNYQEEQLNNENIENNSSNEIVEDNSSNEIKEKIDCSFEETNNIVEDKSLLGSEKDNVNFDIEAQECDSTNIQSNNVVETINECDENSEESSQVNYIDTPIKDDTTEINTEENVEEIVEDEECTQEEPVQDCDNESNNSSIYDIDSELDTCSEQKDKFESDLEDGSSEKVFEDDEIANSQDVIEDDIIEETSETQEVINQDEIQSQKECENEQSSCLGVKEDFVETEELSTCVEQDVCYIQENVDSEPVQEQETSQMTHDYEENVNQNSDDIVNEVQDIDEMEETEQVDEEDSQEQEVSQENISIQDQSEGVYTDSQEMNSSSNYIEEETIIEQDDIVGVDNYIEGEGRKVFSTLNLLMKKLYDVAFSKDPNFRPTLDETMYDLLVYLKNKTKEFGYYNNFKLEFESDKTLKEDKNRVGNYVPYIIKLTSFIDQRTNSNTKEKAIILIGELLVSLGANLDEVKDLLK